MPTCLSKLNASEHQVRYKTYKRKKEKPKKPKNRKHDLERRKNYFTTKIIRFVNQNNHQRPILISFVSKHQIRGVLDARGSILAIRA